MLKEIYILKKGLNKITKNMKEDFIFLPKFDKKDCDEVDVLYNSDHYVVYIKPEYMVGTGHNHHSDRDFEYVELENLNIQGISKVVNDEEIFYRSMLEHTYMELSKLAEKEWEESVFFPELEDIID